jgi:hypothetical protein
MPRIWSANDGGPITALSGHSDVVYAANFSADSKWLVTSSAGTAIVWVVERWWPLATFVGHKGSGARRWPPMPIKRPFIRQNRSPRPQEQTVARSFIRVSCAYQGLACLTTPALRFSDAGFAPTIEQNRSELRGRSYERRQMRLNRTRIPRRRSGGRFSAQLQSVKRPIRVAFAYAQRTPALPPAGPGWGFLPEWRRVPAPASRQTRAADYVE